MFINSIVSIIRVIAVHAKNAEQQQTAADQTDGLWNFVHVSNFIRQDVARVRLDFLYKPV